MSTGQGATFFGSVAKVVSKLGSSSTSSQSKEKAAKSGASALHVNILGSRGIPAAHGGFETFVSFLAPFLLSKGWSVSVYCQAQGSVRNPKHWVDNWEGIKRVHYQTRSKGDLATVEFDLRCVFHVLRQPGIDLVLGYNTAVFNILQRLYGRRVVMNLDGIEWQRKKWGPLTGAWFWANEWIGARTCSVAIADHPEMASHLASRGCKGPVTITYGSPVIEYAPAEVIETYGLKPEEYFLSIARIEPENSILETIQAFVKAETGRKYIVLGKLDPKNKLYHATLLKAASKDVIFPGAIYERKIVEALRFYCLAYVHGHQVGGTNPSLVASLGAGNPVLAHDNKFNRWTAGVGQCFFSSVGQCIAHMRKLSEDENYRAECSRLARVQHELNFSLPAIHAKYLELLQQYL